MVAVSLVLNSSDAAGPHSRRRRLDPSANVTRGTRRRRRSSPGPSDAALPHTNRRRLASSDADDPGTTQVTRHIISRGRGSHAEQGQRLLVTLAGLPTDSDDVSECSSNAGGPAYLDC